MTVKLSLMGDRASESGCGCLFLLSLVLFSCFLFFMFNISHSQADFLHVCFDIHSVFLLGHTLFSNCITRLNSEWISDLAASSPRCIYDDDSTWVTSFLFSGRTEAKLNTLLDQTAILGKISELEVCLQQQNTVRNKKEISTRTPPILISDLFSFPFPNTEVECYPRWSC